MINYSFKIIQANATADKELLGVQLGRFCISKNVPVKQVADDLNVTKSVVYRWFTGRSDVSKHLRDKVTAYKDAITKANPGALDASISCPDSIS